MILILPSTLVLRRLLDVSKCSPGLVERGRPFRGVTSKPSPKSEISRPNGQPKVYALSRFLNEYIPQNVLERTLLLDN